MGGFFFLFPWCGGSGRELGVCVCVCVCVCVLYKINEYYTHLDGRRVCGM